MILDSSLLCCHKTIKGSVVLSYGVCFLPLATIDVQDVCDPTKQKPESIPYTGSTCFHFHTSQRRKVKTLSLSLSSLSCFLC